MARSKLAALLALAFIVLFCFSGLTATTTVKETTASIDMSLPKVLFSLSSASTLLLPLAICAMLCAFVALMLKRSNVGALFAFVSLISFALFLLFFSLEKTNSALYNSLSEQLKALEVKFKKRDVRKSASFSMRFLF